MITEFREYLENLIADLEAKVYLGKIPNEEECVVGLYPSNGGFRVEALGKKSTYTFVPFRLLIHWNGNTKDTTDIATEIYQRLENIRSAETTNYYIAFVTLEQEQPIFIGSDANGVYEYTINGRIYFGR